MLKIISSRASGLCFLLAIFALLAACGGGGGGSGSSTTTPVTPVTPVAAAISVSASSTSVASDNSTTTTITAIVTDASNAAVSGVTVTFSADTGLLSLSSAVSDASGKATVVFSSGTTNPISRTATITATASGKQTQIPISIAGATVTVAASASSLVVGGNAGTLTVTLKTASGGVLAGQPIVLAVTGNGATLAPLSGNSDSSGTLTSTITPTGAGSVVVSVNAVGLTRTIAFTISGAAAAFQITSPANAAAAGFIAVPLTITASAPQPTTRVTFVSTLGTWDGMGSSAITKTVVNGVVSASLVSNLSGIANVQVFDAANQATTSNRSISFTAPPTAAYRLTIQASPGVVAPSKGGTTGVSTLLATVSDRAGNPVSNATVAFSLLNPTGGGETILPVVGVTAEQPTAALALGQVSSTFTSGSLPTAASGITIRASIIPPGGGTPTIMTGTLPSSSDASVVIGGTAGSVTIGRATAGTSDSTGTLYILPMSVLVADSNGNPVANTTVSLSAWPLAFSTGGVDPTTKACVITADYFNEDDAFPGTTAYENLSLDAGEDGVRAPYPNGIVSTGPKDVQLTPPNSAAGTLPATVTTDLSGVATFNLTYTKSNAQWITDRVTARTFVQGTETKGVVIFRLPALVTDLGPPCLLPSSPYL